MIAYGLALRMKIDVDVIMNWSYDKIYDWIAYLSLMEDRDK